MAMQSHLVIAFTDNIGRPGALCC